MHRLGQIVPRIVGYKLFREFNFPRLMPVSITVSTTNQCNSRCKTCNIWKVYSDNPQLRDKELTIKEYESIFENIGNSVAWFTISGGEPYLRPDLVDICKYLYEYCTPKILIIPTNGLLVHFVKSKTSRILNLCKKTSVIVNLSLDGVGSVHDEIRGVPKNFEKAMDTYRHLLMLKEEYDNLEIGVHSVVSKFNIDRLLDVYDYVKGKLDPDSYICEIAENRSELFNVKDDIAPDVSSYESTIKKLRQKIKKDYLKKSGFPRLIQAFRLEYYNLAIEELKQKKQVIPCYAGFASCQISAYGDLWPCCILAYDASFGNLREVDYNFKGVWLSERAERFRKMIKTGHCYCPMANVHYTNMLCNMKTMLKIAHNGIFQ